MPHFDLCLLCKYENSTPLGQSDDGYGYILEDVTISNHDP